MFFEEASFALVRDHGVHDLSRHRVAKALGTSISTVRRLLSSEADLRNLALNEVGHRRRRGRYGVPPEDDATAALWLLRRQIPDTPDRIAEELVWWRLSIAAPTRADLPLDEAHLEEGPLRGSRWCGGRRRRSPRRAHPYASRLRGLSTRPGSAPSARHCTRSRGSHPARAARRREHRSVPREAGPGGRRGDPPGPGRPPHIRWIISSIPMSACGIPPIFGSGKKHMTTYWPAGRS